jgi:hypothetical protein
MFSSASFFVLNGNPLGLLGFWTSSIIPYSKEHNVLETGSVSVLRREDRRIYSAGSVGKSYLNHWIYFRPQVRGWETPALLGPLAEATPITGPVNGVALSEGPSLVGVSHPSSEDGNTSSSRNVMFFTFLSEYRTIDKARKSVIPSGIHHCRNTLEST